MSVYDENPTHPDVRRERENDEMRAAKIRARFRHRVERRRQRALVRGEPRTHKRRCMHEDERSHPTSEYRRVAVWFHPTKGGWRTMTVAA